MKNVLCFGDSNTWGAVPVETYGVNRRYPLQDRWPSVLQSELGSSWHIIAEGLPARTTVLGDAVGGEHFSGLSYLKPCMLSHTPIDWLVVMLGTNDLKRQFDLEPQDVAEGLDRVLIEARGVAELTGDRLKTLVVCPPPLTETGVFAEMFRGASSKSGRLAGAMEAVALKRNASFLDAGKVISSSTVDGIHLAADQHMALGKAVANTLAQLEATP